MPCSEVVGPFGVPSKTAGSMDVLVDLRPVAGSEEQPSGRAACAIKTMCAKTNFSEII